MEEEEIKQMLEFIKNNYDEDGGAIWDIISKEYSENQLEELLERGLVYEPLLGYIKVIN